MTDQCLLLNDGIKYAQSNTNGKRNRNKSMILIRYLLICIIGYLIIRSFVMFGKMNSSGKQGGPLKKDKVQQKKVSKKIGDYIDYEEIKK